MASKYWIKLYHEILDDPKMGLLPDRAWRRCIELFLLAGEQEDGGRLPTLKEMAWRLRVDYGELEADFADLEHAEIIHRDGDRWVVTKFAERQEAVSPAERTRRFRERQRKDQFKTSDMNGHPGNGGGDDDVTTRKRNVTRDETKDETIRYTEVDKESDTDSNSLNAHARDDHKSRLNSLAESLAVVCQIDLDTASPQLRDKAREAVVRLDALEAKPDQILGFSGWWWGDNSPQPYQVVDYWLKYTSEPKRKEQKSYASNSRRNRQDEAERNREINSKRGYYNPYTNETFDAQGNLVPQVQ